MAALFYVFFLTCLWTFNRGDAEVCIFMESCILPCSFQQGDQVVIHWLELQHNRAVHSYYRNQNQLDRQDQHFKHRTSLFTDQISKGNASLRLTEVQLQDWGTYKCYTSTISGNKESFIDINVEAPVRKVNIQQAGNRITCSAEGIYPKPELTWSTSRQSAVTVPDKPTVHQTEQQLYSISSSLTVKDNDDVDYSCTVSTTRNQNRATLFKQTSFTWSSSEKTIACIQNITKTPQSSLIWRFNHSEIILTQTKANTSEGWRKRVEFVSESGRLTLQDLTSDQEGVYTCELSTAEETYVSNTFLRIEKSQREVGTPNVAGITVGVIVILAVIALVVFAIIKKTKLFKRKTSEEEDTEAQTTNPLQKNGGTVEPKQTERKILMKDLP